MTKYTEHQKSLIRSMWLARADDETIARAVGRSPSAIEHHRRENGMLLKDHPDCADDLREWTDGDTASLIDMVKRGLQYSIIGARLSRSKDAIKSRVRKLRANGVTVERLRDGISKQSKAEWFKKFLENDAKHVAAYIAAAKKVASHGDTQPQRRVIVIQPEAPRI